MNKPILALAAAILAAAGLALYWVWDRSAPAGSPSTGPEVELRPDPQPPATPPPPATQEDLDRLARDEAVRSLYFTLRSAFESGKPLVRSQQRIEAALKRLWPGRDQKWTAECRDRVCKVEGEGKPERWRGPLQASRDVAAITDRLAWDPDGGETAAYLLLTQEGGAAGDSILADLQRKWTGSPTVRRCLEQAKGSGALEYELEVDDTGITFRRGGDVQSPARTCVEDELSRLITSTELPGAVKAASLEVTLSP